MNIGLAASEGLLLVLRLVHREVLIVPNVVLRRALFVRVLLGKRLLALDRSGLGHIFLVPLLMGAERGLLGRLRGLRRRLGELVGGGLGVGGVGCGGWLSRGIDGSLLLGGVLV